MKNETLTLTLNNSVHTQPMTHCNMSLEPHSNSEFKNAWAMDKKLNLIWNSRCWVFWAWDMPNFLCMRIFTGLFDLKNTFLCTSNDITYLDIHLAAYLCQKIWKILKNWILEIPEICKMWIILHVWLKKLSNFDFKSGSVFWP